MKKRLLLLSATFLVSMLGFAQGTKPVPKFSDMATDGTTVQYLYNIDAGAFLVGANEWYTRASVGDTGAPVRIEQMNNGLAIGCKPTSDAAGRAGEWCYVGFDDGLSNMWVDAILNSSNYYFGIDNWHFSKQENGNYKITNTLSYGFLSLPWYADGDTRAYMHSSLSEDDRPQSDMTGEYLQVVGNEIQLTNVNEYVAFQMDVTLEQGDSIAKVTRTERVEEHSTSVKLVDESTNTFRIVVSSLNNQAITGNCGAILELTFKGQGNNVIISNAKFVTKNEKGYMVGQSFASDAEKVFGDEWAFVSEADYQAYEEALFESKKLTINVETEGSLRDSILAQVYSLDQVIALTVTGSLNSDDIYTIQECSNLQAIDLSGTTLTEIQSYTFSDRTSLKSVKLPNSLKTIGYQAFSGCTALASIEFPASLQFIESYAFRNCYSLTEVTFNEGLQTIGSYAFQNCKSLAKAIFNEGLQSINYYAFYNTALTEVVLPGTLTYVQAPFSNCNSLQKVTSYAIVPPANDGYLVRSSNSDTLTCTLYVPEMSLISYKNDYGWNCFTNIEGFEYSIDTLYVDVAEAGKLGQAILEKVENFTDVKALVVKGKLNSEDANRIRTSLTNLLYLDIAETTLEEIPYQMFSGKKNLLGIKLPKNLKVINSYAFQGTSNLTSIVLPESLTTIYYGAFAGSGLERIEIPVSCTTFDNYIFGSCRQLREVVLNEGLTQIPNDMFEYCTALEKVNIPSTVQAINGYAFYECNNLMSITLPEGLTYIGNDAFYRTGLQSIELPSTLTRIGYNVFNYCNNLRVVKSYALIPPFNNNNTIWYTDNNTSCDLYVPYLSLIDYKLKAGWDAFTNIYGMEYIPNDIYILNDYTLNVDSTFCAVDSVGNYLYKPNVWLQLNNQSTQSGWTEYGALTINGEEGLILSTGTFSMVNDPNYKHDYSWDANNGNLKRTGTSLVNNMPMRADSVTTRIYLRSNYWQFFSFPYDVKVSDILPVWPNDFVIRKYDGEARANTKMDETWVDIEPDGILEANQGYIWMISNRKEFYDNGNYNWQYYDAYDVPAINNAQKNNLFTYEDVEITLAEYLTEFEHNRSWNLIGNPYPCYYDTRAMQFDAPFTIWNVDNQAYEAYSTTDDAYILDPNQAFFVQRPINQASIVFAKEGRQHTNVAGEWEDKAGAKARRAASQANRSVFNLILSDGEKSDRTRVVLNSQALMDYELDKDASKFAAASITAPQLYTINRDVHYAINERPFGNGTVQLGFTVVGSGNYTIALNTKANQMVMLEDTETGELANLAEGTYSFTATAGTNEGRFLLHIGEEGATAIDAIAANEAANGNELYTLDGRRINGIATQGIYLVKKGQKFQKIFVK